MTKYCGNCGAQMDDDARVCGNCGTPFEDMIVPVQQTKTCPKCGVQMDMEANVCGNCGTPFKVEQKVRQPEIETKKQETGTVPPKIETKKPEQPKSSKLSTRIKNKRFKIMLNGLETSNYRFETILGLASGFVALILAAILEASMGGDGTSFVFIAIAFPFVYSIICYIIIRIKRGLYADIYYDYVKDVSKISNYIGYFLMVLLIPSEFAQGGFLQRLGMALIMSVVFSNIIFLLGIVLKAIALAGGASLESERTTYKNENGKVVARSYKDILGNTIFEDVYGKQVGSATTDLLGTTHYKDENGIETGSSREDAFGTTVFKDNMGLTTGTAKADVLGTVHYEDANGREIGTVEKR